MNFKLSFGSEYFADDRCFEFVERKGLGHPDTLCDLIAEQASIDYSRYFKERFGGFAHHWFDKVTLVGGEIEADFGRSTLISPLHAILIGKGVKQVGKERIPIEKLFSESAAKVLSDILYNFNPATDLTVEVKLSDAPGPRQRNGRYRPDSEQDLVPLGVGSQISNDCNLCVGFSPFTKTEQMVLVAEAFLNSKQLKAAESYIGNDIKLIGTRTEDNYHLLINVPFIADETPSKDFYLEKCAFLVEAVIEEVRDKVGIEVEITLNPQNQRDQFYLTRTGTVADTGDVGVVGRGNRLNGLITPMRPMSIEASAGKNPLDHTGKLYSVAAEKLAARLYGEFKIPVVVFLSSMKGADLEAPLATSVHFQMNSPVITESKINSILLGELEGLGELSVSLATGAPTM